ncbi:hypothetical protein [Rhodopila globiformis]|uniref:hypothetical protein n=1 Tax=Rhodopila globiformis TaxID=1071 RepID=UPI001304A2EF|nr:hypothetical protein [Rhodopila globiformis]
MVSEWTLYLIFGAFVCAVIILAARLLVHTQQRLASVNEKDWLIDALVWINRHTSRRPR